MTHAVDEQEKEALAEAIKDVLLMVHGPLLAGDLLWRVLGYSTVDGLRQAVHRKNAPIEMMQLDNTPKKFAMIYDVANWLAEQRLLNTVQIYPTDFVAFKQIPLTFKKLFLHDNGMLLTQEQLALLFYGGDEQSLMHEYYEVGAPSIPAFRIEHRGRRLFALAIDVLPMVYAEG